MHNDVFLTNSEVFDIVVNNCLECLILLLEQLNWFKKEKIKDAEMRSFSTDFQPLFLTH